MADMFDTSVAQGVVGHSASRSSLRIIVARGRDCWADGKIGERKIARYRAFSVPKGAEIQGRGVFTDQLLWRTIHVSFCDVVKACSNNAPMLLSYCDLLNQVTRHAAHE
jgi:hypothetical protein